MEQAHWGAARAAPARSHRDSLGYAGWVALLFAPCMGLAANVGDVRGIVHDGQHRPIAEAHVELRSVTSDWSRSAASSTAGEFSFPGVPLGDYELEVERAGFADSALRLTVISGPAPITHVLLSPDTPKDNVTVSAAAVSNPESVTPTTLLSREDIARTPGADRTNSLAMITDFVPGSYVVHDQLHVRGGHQVTWEIDGVEIPNTNIASNLGPQIDPKDIDYLEIERGSYGAAEGDRTYGIFNIVPRTGFERNNEAEFVVSAGNYGQTNDSLSVGGHTNDFAYYASVNGNRSDLGLMTPDERILHDTQDGYGGFTTLLYNLTPADQLRLVASVRRDDYQIPDVPEQLADDVQREADAYTILSWMHQFSSSTVLSSSLFYHYNRADLDAAPGDYPISTTDQRASSYFGGQESLHVSSEPNDIEAGLLGFGQYDNQSFNVLFNDGSNPTVVQSLRLSGSIQAAYLQDTYRATSWLTLSGGVRQTRFEGLITENATDPRLGISIKIPGCNWVLRAFWGKFYQPPPLETISGPLLAFAQNNNLGFLPLRGERDQEYQYGLTIPLAGWVIDIDHFRTRVENFFDHNPIGNSNAFLPITITGALLRATELTVRTPRIWSHLQAHVAYSNQSADGFGAITGGLTDFSPPGGRYALDHDQRNTLNTGLEVQLARQLFASANLYYGSGFSNGHAPPSHLPGHASLDVGLGRTFNRQLTVSVTVLNVTNHHLLIDNSLTFDGVHWNNPRELYAEVHYKFGY